MMRNQPRDWRLQHFPPPRSSPKHATSMIPVEELTDTQEYIVKHMSNPPALHILSIIANMCSETASCWILHVCMLWYQCWEIEGEDSVPIISGFKYDLDFLLLPHGVRVFKHQKERHLQNRNLSPLKTKTPRAILTVRESIYLHSSISNPFTQILHNWRRSVCMYMCMYVCKQE